MLFSCNYITAYNFLKPYEHALIKLLFTGVTGELQPNYNLNYNLPITKILHIDDDDYNEAVIENTDQPSNMLNITEYNDFNLLTGDLLKLITASAENSEKMAEDFKKSLPEKPNDDFITRLRKDCNNGKTTYDILISKYNEKLIDECITNKLLILQENGTYKITDDDSTINIYLTEIDDFGTI